jgi:hypothetical protein
LPYQSLFILGDGSCAFAGSPTEISIADARGTVIKQLQLRAGTFEAFLPIGQIKKYAAVY